MSIAKDGSLGAWGGKKYEGLGSRDVHSYLFRHSVCFENKKVNFITAVFKQGKRMIEKLLTRFLLKSKVIIIFFELIFHFFYLF